jgi:hypothetical protein
MAASDQFASQLNLGAFGKATELKKRLWFTLGALVVYRLGTYIPIPGIDAGILNDIFQQQAGGILGMFNMFSGGALERLQAAVDAGRIDVKAPVNAEVLLAAGVIRRIRDGLRLLGGGELKAKLDITVAGATKSAVAAVEKAGGTITQTVVKAEKNEAAAGNDG